MGKYSFILEFSGIDSVTYSPADARNAERQAVDYLGNIGLGNPDVYGGKWILAKVRTGKGGTVKGVTLECENEVDISKIVSALECKGVSFKHTLGQIESVSQFKNQDVEFRILYKVYAQEGVPEVLSEGPGGPETMKVAYEGIDEVIYQILGDGESSSHEKGIAHGPARQNLLKSLKTTIREIVTGNGRKPIVYYLDDGDSREADIMPPLGTTIARLGLTGEFVPDNNRQKRGVIYYTHAGIDVRVHRRNIREKYDIKGRLENDSLDGRKPVQDNSEVGNVSQILSSLPVQVTAGEGEISVGYRREAGRLSLLISPKKGESLSVIGFDEAVSAKKIMLKNANKRDVKCFEVPGQNVEVTIFTQGSSSRSEWDDKFSDDFDKFYDSWLLARGRGGQ